MKIKAVVFSFATLSGCVTFPPSATAWISCESGQCDALWSRAQVWLAKNSQYRIQLVNDNIIQTYGPLEAVGGVAYTVTKEKQLNGKTKIFIRGHCYPTVYGCANDPSIGANALYYELTKP